MTNSESTTEGNWRADPSSQASAQQRALIVAAARDCINESGHEKLRMEGIARKAKCSRATVYRYFKNKKEILLTIALENHQQIHETVEEITLEIPDERMKLAVGLAHTMKLARTADATYRFVTEIVHQAMLSGDSEFRDVIAMRIAPVYQIAQHKDWLRADVSEDEAVNWIILCSAGLMAMGWPMLGGRELDPEEQVNYLCRHLLYPIFKMDGILSV